MVARGPLGNAVSMEYVAATRNTDSRVRLVQTRLIEINLMHVQNRTKTVHPMAKALSAVPSLTLVWPCLF